MSLGTTIRRHRRVSGKTLRSLGGITGADFTYLSKIENDRAVPSEELARRIDRALNATGDVTEAWRRLRCPTCGGPRR